MIIDAHQHFWRYDPQTHAWIGDEMSILRKDFLPGDVLPLLEDNQLDGCIAVQADESEKDTIFLLQLAKENSFIKGVVGWVDLCSGNIEERLEFFAEEKLLKGFRPMLQGYDPSFMLQSSFLNGIGLLHRYGFSFDLLIHPHHLTAATTLVKQFPDQKFVIDHIGKPSIRTQDIHDWAEKIKAISKHENVSCKISGLVTEASWDTWNEEALIPYLDIVTEAFGVNRLLYGSDWPVALVATSYHRWISTARNYFASFSKDEQQKIFGENATEFYHLK